MGTRTHVVLPADLLEELDKVTGSRKRSEFIEAAVREKLDREKRMQTLLAAVGMFADEDIPGWETVESTAAWVREQREMNTEQVESSRTLATVSS